MKVFYTDRAKQKEEGYRLLQQAKQPLEEVIGSSRDLVTAEWDRGEDPRGRLVFILRLQDPTGWVSAVFAPDELQSPDHLNQRFNRLWGDLLQVRLDKQMEALTNAGGSEAS